MPLKLTKDDTVAMASAEKAICSIINDRNGKKCFEIGTPWMSTFENSIFSQTFGWHLLLSAKAFPTILGDPSENMSQLTTNSISAR